ncbi:MAG: hypothetical protein LW823_09245 [Rickettsiales bacterium]|jgi:hypothetical protein|nr:hypothetical protein [Rickettsiales bacterium]
MRRIQIVNRLQTVFLFFLFLLGNWHHYTGLNFENYPSKIWNDKIYTTHWLNNQIKLSNNHWYNWRDIGLGLRNSLKYKCGNSVTISTSAAGAITYYSELAVYDLLGLNKREVRDSKVIFNKSLVGHKKIASYKQLIDAKVNILIWHASAICKFSDGHYSIPSVPNRYHPIKRNRTLLIPGLNGCYIIADYITPNSCLDELIRDGVIIDYREEQTRYRCPSWLCLK